MRFRYIVVLLVILSYAHLATAQVKDSIRYKQTIRRSILPSALIGAGIVINHSQFEKNFQEKLRSNVIEDFHLSVDDYLQYVPIAEMYLADALGVKSRNHWFDQTKYLLISNLISSGITHGLKNLTAKTRPNGDPFSFPSGHTTLAFTNATVLFNEFNETSPVLAYSGYAFATTTGVFRMLNNKHWLSDVLVGAGIGMLVTELVYYFEPFKAFNPFKKSSSITLIPKISGQQYGFYFSWTL
jgi:hypothetical protein